MTLPTAAQLALQIDEHRASIADADARLRTLIAGLTVGDDYYAQHAEEHLGWVTDALKGTVRSLTYLQRYTVTGSKRVQIGRQITADELAAIESER